MNMLETMELYDGNRAAKGNADSLRQAMARRRVQEMHDEKMLQSWLTEVWDESA